jgi:hypothetical protein
MMAGCCWRAQESGDGVELGLGAEFRKVPQSRLTGLLLPGTDSQPQWDLLNLLAEAASRKPTFTLRMSTEATGLVVADDG